ncbi:hypothetical protein JTE90_001404 [Oedothorax gibbosus]|uniref:Uncharacterized protein n=1 Tax=Oedothorax gibbosus TaxID=931172 RepID=A0AAV6VF07_9ARAC|nr:hypothetical protein JTE90_001404 [Oedothorax gibbosus]
MNSRKLLKTLIGFFLWLSAAAALAIKEHKSQIRLLKPYGRIFGVHKRVDPVKKGEYPIKEKSSNTIKKNTANIELRFLKRLKYGRRKKILFKNNRYLKLVNSLSVSKNHENSINLKYQSQKKKFFENPGDHRMRNKKPVINFAASKRKPARKVAATFRKQKQKSNSSPTAVVDNWTLDKEEIKRVLKKVQKIKEILKKSKDSAEVSGDLRMPRLARETASENTTKTKKPKMWIWILLGLIITLLKVSFDVFSCVYYAKKKGIRYSKKAMSENEVPLGSFSIDLPDTGSDEILLDYSDMEEYKSTSLFMAYEE